MKMKNIEDLLTHELKDLYHCETQLVRALPKIAKAASSPELQHAIEEHLEQTRAQVQRLETIFSRLNLPKRGKKCKAIEGMLAEGKELIETEGDGAVKDAALIAAAQRVEHYEIAAYGCARTFAQLLGHPEIADLLQESLNEESQADEKLTELATGKINPAARETPPAGVEDAKSLSPGAKNSD